MPLYEMGIMTCCPLLHVLNRDTFERVAAISARGEEASVHVEMSFLEIYNESVYDLLAAASTVRIFCFYYSFEDFFSPLDLVEKSTFGHDRWNESAMAYFWAGGDIG